MEPYRQLLSALLLVSLCRRSHPRNQRCCLSEGRHLGTDEHMSHMHGPSHLKQDVYMGPAGWCLSVRRVAGDSPNLPAGMTAACNLVAPVLAATDNVAPHVNGKHLAGFLGGGMGSVSLRWAP